jgi:hypothetical protein
MALDESVVWEPEIYDLKTDDPVEGGLTGVDNRAPRQLANRLQYVERRLRGVGYAAAGANVGGLSVRCGAPLEIGANWGRWGCFWHFAGYGNGVSVITFPVVAPAGFIVAASVRYVLFSATPGSLPSNVPLPTLLGTAFNVAASPPVQFTAANLPLDAVPAAWFQERDFSASFERLPIDSSHEYTITVRSPSDPAVQDPWQLFCSTPRVTITPV